MTLIQMLHTSQKTGDDRVATGIRLLLAVLFVMTGVMKLAVPSLGAAFAGQLAGANIPLEELNRWVVPFLEIGVGVGVALGVGYYTRITTLLVYDIMLVATYVHVVVDDPSLFPLQPEEPVIPAVVMMLAVYLIVKGGGSRSLDLKATGGAARSPNS